MAAILPPPSLLLIIGGLLAVKLLGVLIKYDCSLLERLWDFFFFFLE